MPQTDPVVPYLDVEALNSRFRESDMQLFERFHKSGQYIGGRLLHEFENQFAGYYCVDHCIGCGNGLEALTLILLAEKSLGNLPDHARILVPAHTYVATILSVLHAGMQPVLVDVEDMHLNPQSINDHADEVDAVIGVDLYGKLIDRECFAFAKAKNLPIYTDAAQAHGAFYTDRKFIPRAAAFSFYPTKNLGAMGDGGAVLTDDGALAEKIRQIANYGRESRFENIEVGLNSRLDPLQAGFLSIRLEKLDADNDSRRKVANRYIEHIKNDKLDIPDSSWLKNNVHHVIPVFTKGYSPRQEREQLIAHLNSHGIGHSLHYPIPPHKQKALEKWNHCSFPRTEYLAESQLSLPCHPALRENHVQKVIQAVNSF